MEKILHLFITNNCRHNCKLCCNKFYKIPEIPVVSVELLKSVNTVCLTGGEPFWIKPEILANFIIKLRTQYKNIENLYIYTSGKELGENLGNVMTIILSAKSPWLTKSIQIDGITVGPKDFEDWVGLIKAMKNVQYFFNGVRSNRLYIFKEHKEVYEIAKISFPKDCEINVISRKWDMVFNTPKNEYFARLPILL